jgi:hypothetical protein
VTAKRPPATIQAQILEQLKEVKDKVDESLKQGADNGKQIELIKMALGMDGAHGRLPELERAIARIDSSQESDHKDVLRRVEALEKDLRERTEALTQSLQSRTEALEKGLEVRIETLETGDRIAQGKRQAFNIFISVLCSSGAAVFVGWLAHHFGVVQ